MPSTISQTVTDRPLAKRLKLSGEVPPRGPKRDSRIFTPFRTIGLVSSTPVPFTSVPLGKTTFQITTSVGRCLQTYDLKRGLNLVFLTRPQTPEDITATAAWKDRVIAAWGGSNDSPQGVSVFKRGKEIARLDVPAELKQPIKQLLIFGAWIVGCGTTRMEVWKSASYEHYTTLYPTATHKGKNELTGGITNMPTYLNKIFAGRSDGSVEIWNVSSGKLIYTILPPAADCGAVTALQPTPALSLLAIAYSAGHLIIHDILTDKTRISLNSGSSRSLVTSISFRTDELGAGEDGRKPGVMATAGPQTGDVTFWDLNGGGRVMGVLRGAHNPSSGATVSGGVSKVEFLSGQPVVVTSGLDNSLKSWVFDETPYSPIPRILHTRSGHAAPVSRLLFLPTDSDGADAGGKWLLSAGKDRSLWSWSLRRDGQSTELSQGNIRKKAKKMGILNSVSLGTEPSATLEDLKAPEITCLAMSLNRDGGMGANAGSGAIWQKANRTSKKATDATLSGVTGWESVITGHKEDKFARTWFWGRKKAGRWAFETGDGEHVSSVGISPCGTFAVVGSDTGGIDTFNLQSGMHRKRFPSKLTPSQAKRLKIEQLQAAESLEIGSKPANRFTMGLGKHTKAITGLVVDSLNKHLISCSTDGRIKFWDFSNGHLVDEIDWHNTVSITGIRYHAPNDLIAVTSDDLSIRVVDIETKRTIRELWGCAGAINDFCFSSDGRWIIAASSDRIVRVWDLPTGHLIDAIRMRTQCTALAFSATGEFLATTCEGEIGVNIWNNKTLFTHVPTRHISEDEIAEMSAPTVSGEGGHGAINGAFEEEEDDPEDSAPAPAIDQLSADMMTLSLMPKSRWQTLLHLDLIKQRNKPTEAPKVPEKAPFFLPSLEKPNPIGAVPDEKKTEERIAERSRIMKMDRCSSEGAFTVALRSGSDSGDYTPFISHLKTLSPSAADLEIRSLDAGLESESDELVNFVEALTGRLQQKRDYELVQAWMTVFLRLHMESVGHDERLVQALREWRECQEAEGARLGDLVGFCGGVVGFLRSPRT
ncbi:Utp21 specific WD40 associated putative domain-containing protein [Amylocarpus encephaloides]|uniref:Utp21 specific WD40 associated putative domain-containing protein n=1 Tax=Amylocarpus encephaloides TaxID=45428 RepID=A0A9P7Y8X9_9HELO|nr:Utp21 specific WD40 associated putative domain-containing protein [Amylocarpus encephaloides]